MNHLAITCYHLTHWNLPSLSRRDTQHFLDGSTCDTHAIGPGGANAETATGNLQIKRLGGTNENAIDSRNHKVRHVDAGKQHAFTHRIVSELANGRSFLELDQTPVGIKLICKHLCQCCANALAHFRVWNDGRDHIITIELYPGMKECFTLACHVFGQFAGAIAWANRNTHN